MEKHHLILIGGALALLWYCNKQKNLNASTAAASAPSAGTTYTTTQAAAASQWYNFPGLWAGSNAAA